MIAYVDSSVFLRKILGQPLPLAEWGQISETITSALAELECLRVLDRARHHGLTQRQHVAARASAFELLAATQEITITPIVLSRAAQSFPVPLRTLDAIHLASALLWRESHEPTLVLATHDIGLSQAAKACGMAVVGV